MKQSVFVKPTKPALIAGIIACILFLGFGVFFFILLSGESESYIGQGFLIFWMLFVSGIGIYFIYNLVNFDKKNTSAAGVEIEIPDAINIHETGDTFDGKLKKLEEIRKEGLITEDEFSKEAKGNNGAKVVNRYYNPYSKLNVVYLK